MNELEKMLLEEVLDDYCLLEEILKNLIFRKKYELAEELLKKTSKPPHEVIIDIFNRLDKEGFLKLANYFTEELSSDYWEEATGEYKGALASFLIIILECVVPSTEEDKQIKNEMRLWIEENYTTMRCPHCKALLTTEPETEGNTIYLKACIPLTFNRKSNKFEEDLSSYWHSEYESNLYYCSNCDKPVSKTVKNFI